MAFVEHKIARFAKKDQPFVEILGYTRETSDLKPSKLMNMKGAIIRSRGKYSVRERLE